MGGWEGNEWEGGVGADTWGEEQPLSAVQLLTTDRKSHPTRTSPPRTFDTGGGRRTPSVATHPPTPRSVVQQQQPACRNRTFDAGHRVVQLVGEQAAHAHVEAPHCSIHAACQDLGPLGDGHRRHAVPRIAHDLGRGRVQRRAWCNCYLFNFILFLVNWRAERGAASCGLACRFTRDEASSSSCHPATVSGSREATQESTACGQLPQAAAPGAPTWMASMERERQSHTLTAWS